MKRSRATRNRIWIELERPTLEEGDEAGHERAGLANQLLSKLGCDSPLFRWFPEKRRYILEYRNGAGFYYLEDSGEWFNLDKLAKENEKVFDTAPE